MTTLGKIEEFDVRGGKIDRYLERLERYFVANNIPPDSETSSRQRAILISVLAPKAYDILFDLCSPNSPSSKSFADLKTILKSHFAPKRLTIAERYRFHNCTQTESESVSKFAANLKKLASTCEFGTFFLMLYVIVLCVAYEVQACKRNCWLIIIHFNKRLRWP